MTLYNRPHLPPNPYERHGMDESPDPAANLTTAERFERLPDEAKVKMWEDLRDELDAEDVENLFRAAIGELDSDKLRTRLRAKLHVAKAWAVESKD